MCKCRCRCRCMYTNISICLSIYPSIHLSTHLPIYPSTYLRTYLPYLPIPIYLPIYLSIYRMLITLRVSAGEEGPRRAPVAAEALFSKPIGMKSTAGTASKVKTHASLLALRCGAVSTCQNFSRPRGKRAVWGSSSLTADGGSWLEFTVNCCKQAQSSRSEFGKHALSL